MGFRVLNTTSIAVSGTSARVAIPYPSVQDRGGQGNVCRLGNAVRLQADGADMRFKIGKSDVVATTSDALVQDNTIEPFSVAPDIDTHIAVIGSVGTLQITVGTDDGGN